MEEEKKITCSKRELRNRAKASLEQEARILDELLSEAATSAVVIVPPLKPAVEARLGKPLAPDTSHLQADLAAREAWKKLPERLAEEVGNFCGLAPAATNVSGRSTFRPRQRCAALLGQAIPSSHCPCLTDATIHLHRWCNQTTGWTVQAGTKARP